MSGFWIPPGSSMADIKRIAITSALEQTKGNRMQAARLLKISIRTLRNKIKEFGLASAAGETSTNPNGRRYMPMDTPAADNF